MMIKYEPPSDGQLMQIIQTITGLEHEKVWLITIEKKRKRASMKQRGYYHGILLIAIALFLGWDEADLVHEHIKNRFNKVQRKMPDGKVVEVGGSTSAFNTKQYTLLIDKVRNVFLPEMYAMGMEYVPTPEELDDEYVYKLKQDWNNRYN
jgi:hypothetical protein